MTTVQVLRAARARIDTPDKWCQRTGVIRTPDDGLAFCALGALGAVAGWRHRERLVSAREALGRAMGVEWMYVAGFNDSHSHAEVLAAFDIAIRNEEAREQEHNVPALIAAPPVELVA